MSEVSGVGRDVSDIGWLIERVGDDDGFFEGKWKRGGGRLLEGRGNKRRGRFSGCGFVLRLEEGVGGFLEES